MAVKVKLGSKDRPLLWRLARFFGFVALFFLVVGACIFGIYYRHYDQVVDDRLAAGPLFAQVAQIYAAPQEIRPGQHLTAASIAAELRRAGYNAQPQLGSFQMRGPDTILIKPGPQSFHSTDGATINTLNGDVQSITAENGVALRSYQLEPQLITALSEDKGRAKRRLVTYKDIPPRMVQAVVAIEDHRFFEHSGINYVRTVKCGVQDLLSKRMNCGGSTVTQQLARGFFLTPDKKIKRKLEEIMITYQLESRFNKQQIFEMYANQIPMGQRGSFAVAGFGEAAQAYFGKNLGQLDTAECALLAGIIQRPSYFNPYKHPDRAMARRNIVLDQMAQTDAITTAEAERAKAEPLHLAPANVDSSEAPYFVDLVHDQIVQRVGEQASAGASLRIYTSLDPDLQRAAAEAVEAGMKNVDELVRKRHRKNEPDVYPQVALVALNPHTGQVLALVGGRSYGTSQLNHAVAKRPTGSIFKPFVYATAEQGAVNGQQLEGGTFTATTILHDVETTFTFDNGRQTYNPGNYEGKYFGDVTAIFALAHSLNNATISLGQQVGFENVAALGRASGIVNAKGTPAVSLGAYDATPLDMAGAYTVFANGGVHLNPWLLSSVRNATGDIIADFTPEARQVMDPRAAFLTQSLLEGVMNFGYGTAVRKAGFTAPAAGKTGTSHDAWFAAYSSNLICVVWVGNDDYTDVKLSGAIAAAPIWAEFMNRAIRLPQYSDMTAFTPPDGVHVYRIDRATNQLADASCPSDNFAAAFLDGTQPQGTCSHMGEDAQSLANKLFGVGGNTQSSSTDAQPADAEKHRNFLQKMLGTGKKPDDTPSPPH
jgi:penicillin-binding protein 1B